MIYASPYIKPKGFLNAVAPIVHKGIPHYADSVVNSKCIGTADWEKFWDDELYKIINGVQIGGMWVPGFFYWYINYKQMSTIKGVVNPDMVDLHLEFAYYLDYCEKNGINLLSPKGRRKGVSEEASFYLDYRWRFTEGFKGGVAAGNKTYVDDFLSKWRFSDSRLPPEFSVKKLVDNDDEIVAGYSIKNAHNAYEEKGTFNTIYARTMHTNPNMFKGLYLNVVISEEIGEHENWIDFYGATKDCLMSGNKQSGFLIGFGTGGNVNKGSKDFKKVASDLSAYNFIEFLIPATRFYYYGGAKEINRQLPAESELYKQYKPYELIGVEDRVLAEKNILDRRASLLKQGNLKEYNEDLQNNPITKAEIFRKTVVNDFNINKLNEQDAKIMALTHPKWSKYKLEWVKDERGQIKIPLAVVCKPLKPTDDQDECIWIIDSEHPRKSHSNLYVAGIDSYDQDKAKASKSLGAMSIRIRHNHIPNAMKNSPVAVISCRPKRKEHFYELCMKASVYYGFDRMNVGNVLGDVANALIMEHFKSWGLWQCLADRPKKFESESSEQSHEKWVRLTNFSRPRRGALMQTWVEDGIQDCWFPEMINQYGNFDIMEVGSDNDLADADGIALMQDVSCDIKPRDEENDEISDRYKLPEFVKDAQGNLVIKKEYDGTGLLNPEQDGELFRNMFGL